MIRFLLHRPIAVWMTTGTLAIFSLIALRQLPVSLLPAVDVPEIVIRTDYPGHGPMEIEEAILAPMRETMATVNGLEKLESHAAAGRGIVRLRFSYTTSMDLAFIEVNEKTDRLAARLPRDAPRPAIARLNISDIPLLQLHVIPDSSMSLYELSELGEKVLKKRIEQVKGISLVDVNGLRYPSLQVIPNMELLNSLGLSEEDLIAAIRNQNISIGTVLIRDGHYEYDLQVETTLDREVLYTNLPVFSRNGRTFYLHELATLEEVPQQLTGYELINEQNAVTFRIHKQPQAKMLEVRSDLYAVMDQLKQDYPYMQFAISQDQSELLNVSVDNLTSSLLIGGIAALAMLFLFMRNPKVALIMAIGLPLSVLISFSLFYIFGLPITIISLSGMAMGIGMLIDNAIIVLENITRKRHQGLPLDDACVQGVAEIGPALVSSALTTVGIFLPLIFISGISGALFKDQALSIAIILGVSLLVAFLVLPVLYRQLMQLEETNISSDTLVSNALEKGYDAAFNRIWANKPVSLIGMLLLIPLGWIPISNMETTGLPALSRTDAVVRIDWNEPVTIEENRRRVGQLTEANPVFSQYSIGLQDFILNNSEQGIAEATLYLNYDNQDTRVGSTQNLEKVIHSYYPAAKVQLLEPENAFNAIFPEEQAELEARIRKPEGGIFTPEELSKYLSTLSIPFSPGAGMETGWQYQLEVDHQAIERHQIEYSALNQLLERVFTRYAITELQSVGSSTPILLGREASAMDFSSIYIEGGSEHKPSFYPVSQFIELIPASGWQAILADRSGIYYNLIPEQANVAEMEKIRKWVTDWQLLLDFSGRMFETQELQRELLLVLLLSVALLYLVLAAQFESFWQPVIIMLTLPVGVSGALWLLWASGNSLNLMSMTGLVIMLGIMVNDAILKVDTVNRLRKQGVDMDIALQEAGKLRLKPILMTTLTTLLALIPLLFFKGLGAELQHPLVWSVIGGLTMGTLTSLFLVPLLYRIWSWRK